MKIILTLSFLSATFLLFSQQNYEVVKVNKKSILLKGTISGSPITMYLENNEIIDCDLYNRYIDGWYYYDKFKIKIPLYGFLNNCDMKLFHYEANHLALPKKALKEVTQSNIDSIYQNSDYLESLSFDRCVSHKDGKRVKWNGIFEKAKRKSKIIIDSDEIWIGKDYEYFTLPNLQKIDLMQIFKSYAGNTFVCLKEDNTENRVVFYFRNLSNHNLCGVCGSEEEEGYRILYFDKRWKIKNMEEFKIESCIEGIYNTEIIKQTKSLTQYLIKEVNGKPNYYLTIDNVNSKLTKTR